MRACFAALAALALVAHPVGAWAWCRTTTVRPAVPGDCSTTGIPLGWHATSCGGFSLFAGGSPDIAADVLASEAASAAARWHAAPCDENGQTQPYFAIVRVADTADPTGYDPGGPNASTVSFNAVWHRDAQHREGTISVTLVSFDAGTGEILDADIEFDQLSDRNPEGFHFTVDPPGPDDVDLDTILVHEFGHFQGLGHSMVDLAVMWPEAGLGERRRDLRADDAEAICAAYAPDSPLAGEPCNPTPRGGFQADAPPPGCGCRTARTPEGGTAWALTAVSLVLRRRRSQRGALDRAVDASPRP